MSGLELEVLSTSQFQKLMEHAVPRYLIFDIETGPLPDEQLWDFVDDRKIKFPPEPKPFNPQAIKYGNIKDPAKKSAKLLAAKQSWQLDVANYNQAREDAKTEYFHKFRSEAPLAGHLNVVLAIGYGILTSDGQIHIYLDIDQEAALVHRFWVAVRRVRQTNGALITWNGDSFDIPIMTQKGWKYDEQPPYLLTKYGKIDPDLSIDGKKYFQMGNWQRAAGLDAAAKFFGVTGKVKGMTGDQFWKILPVNPSLAREYLWHDIDTTYRCCSKMGLLDDPLQTLRRHAAA